MTNYLFHLVCAKRRRNKNMIRITYGESLQLSALSVYYLPIPEQSFSVRLLVISTELNSKKMSGPIILKIGTRSRAAPTCAFGGLLPTSTGRRRSKPVISERLAPVDHH